MAQVPLALQADVQALLPRPSFMDISPHKIPTNTRNSGSTASTPMDHHAKRMRDEELDALLEAAPPSKRLETTPCHTPTHSPEHCGIERMAMTTPQAFGTPISSHVCDVHAAAAAAELRIRWANAQRQGPRACAPHACTQPGALKSRRRCARPACLSPPPLSHLAC